VGNILDILITKRVVHDNNFLHVERWYDNFIMLISW